MSARNKLDCRVCGQDVFAKTVVHVHGTRRTVTAVGWCKQCGNGVRRREVFEANQHMGEAVAVRPHDARGREKRPSGTMGNTKCIRLASE